MRAIHLVGLADHDIADPKHPLTHVERPPNHNLEAVAVVAVTGQHTARSHAQSHHRSRVVFHLAQREIGQTGHPALDGVAHVFRTQLPQFGVV